MGYGAWHTVSTQKHALLGMPAYFDPNSLVWHSRFSTICLRPTIPNSSLFSCPLLISNQKELDPEGPGLHFLIREMG